MNVFVNILLPLFWFAALAFLLIRNKYLQQNGIPAWLIVSFFTAKCLAGFLYSYVALKYVPNRGDIWPFFEDGLALYKTFLQSPAAFISQVKQMFDISDVGVMNSHSDFIRTAFEGIKFIHFILNLFSFGNLYTNTILFNGLAVWLFLRCCICLREYSGSWVPGAWIFLFPSAFLYSSGIHKEGIVLILIAALLPLSCQLYKRAGFFKFFSFLLLFLLFFFLKFFVAILFLASLFLWFLLEKFPKRKKLIVVLAVFLGVSGFFLSGILSPATSLPQYIVNRQQEFLAFDAKSEFSVSPLKPDFISFCKALPSAINNVFFKPLPGEGGKAMYSIYTLEIFLFWGLIIYLVIKSRLRVNPENVGPLFWALLLFALCNLLVIGYTIPNIGATMRYRSIFLPFIGVFAWLIFNGSNIFFSKNKGGFKL